MAAHDVYLDATKAGTLEQTSRRLTFSYDDAYRDGPEPTPLSTSMPPAGRRFGGRRVEAFLWGLLPDNDLVLQRWANQFQVSLASPVGLISAVGRDLPGAVSVVPAGEELGTEGEVTWLDTNEIGDMLARVRADQTAWLGEGRWSLAGAQPKIALLETERGWGRPSGSAATNRILKPAIPGLADHDINEHLCLVAARKLGLRAARSRVATFGAERAIVVERFDRRPDPTTGSIHRIHQEDLCQALGVHPSAKYQNDGGPGVEDVARVIREHLGTRHLNDDLAAFVDALVFNWLIAAPDAHAKNYSLLLHGSGVRLAPLYDIASSLPYPEFYAPKMKLAMKIGGYYRAGVIGTTAWERCSHEVGLEPDLVVARAQTLAGQLGDAFRDGASEFKGGDEAAAARTLSEKVAEWSAACRRRLS